MMGNNPEFMRLCVSFAADSVNTTCHGAVQRTLHIALIKEETSLKNAPFIYNYALESSGDRVPHTGTHRKCRTGNRETAGTV